MAKTRRTKVNLVEWQENDSKCANNDGNSKIMVVDGYGCDMLNGWVFDGNELMK